MGETWMPEVRPDSTQIVARANEIIFVADVEEWLRTRPCNPVTWSARGKGAQAVCNVGELVARVEELHDEGSWGVVRRPQVACWAQCMRVDGGWIVEVNGIPGPECFARRVQTLRPARFRALRMRRRVRDQGRVMADYHRQDVIPTAHGAAEIMWSWLRGGLPADYELRDL